MSAYQVSVYPSLDNATNVECIGGEVLNNVLLIGK